MDITIFPGRLSGTVDAIPSKSIAHRLLICAAFSDGPTELICQRTSDDIEVTAQCLRQIGADIVRNSRGYLVNPIQTIPDRATLDCKESGSTLRFLLPIVAALGIETTFLMSGRLPYRPMAPLWEELCNHNVNLSRPAENTILCRGRLNCGNYSIDGSVSSQFVSGLMLALSLLESTSTISITGSISSKNYIELTKSALRTFGVDTASNVYGGHFPFRTPSSVHIEGDWSNAAFFIVANSLGNNIKINGLLSDSLQGDRIVIELSQHLTEHPILSVSQTPDLLPILAILAAYKQGAIFTDIERLQYKESNRVESTTQMLRALGVRVDTSSSAMTVYSSKICGGSVDSFQDHRIAMAAAIAATVADGPVIIHGAESVSKSYPDFWCDYSHLGGLYEYNIR